MTTITAIMADITSLKVDAIVNAGITLGYALPARHVIHAVGPRWSGGNRGEPDILAACYSNSLALAAERGLRSIAYPAISTGVYRYPVEMAAEIAAKAVIAQTAGRHQSDERLSGPRGSVWK